MNTSTSPSAADAPGAQESATTEAVAQLVAGGPDFQIENTYCRRDGSLLKAQSNATALRSPEGEFVRTLENFRKDLKALHDAGYRPVTMRQVLEGNIDIPRGTTPVVFTMDDATRGQFYLRPDGSVDTNTMMGSWMSFKEQNPSWGPGGMVWCILPAAAHPSNFFGETKDRDTPREQREANIRKKMEIIVRDGHEVCNHTLYHARLDRASGVQQAMDWIGIGEDSIKAYLPADYDIVTFALPLGMWPDQKSAAWEGTYRNGKRYENKVVLEVSGGPSVTPWDTRWDPHSVDRFIVAPGALERQLQHWERDPTNRYVSDGDPRTVSYPASMAQYLNRGALGGRTAQEGDEPARPRYAHPLDGPHVTVRVIEAPRYAAELAFAYGSFMVGHLQHDNILRSAIWLPGRNARTPMSTATSFASPAAVLIPLQDGSNS